ncbi:hypothetical protein K438DRAFT_771775 [Mycena galopus ATCC 62051]|nr:hypothetical protein K438DRAFT_771775 [Mycena galopus ATCC 62051]
MLTEVCSFLQLFQYSRPSNRIRVDDYYTLITRWVSHTWAIIVAWVQESFAAAMKWTHDKTPAVIAWLENASSSASRPIMNSQGASTSDPRRLWLYFPRPSSPVATPHRYASRLLLILTILGFGARGIVRDSPAASYQSLCYGGNTLVSSLFTILQSIRMKYHTVTLGNWVLATVRLLAGVLFVYAALGMILWW